MFRDTNVSGYCIHVIYNNNRGQNEHVVKTQAFLKCIELRIFSPAVILVIRDAFIQTVFLPNRIMRQFFNEHNPICLTKVYIRVIQYQNVSTIIILRINYKSKKCISCR